MPLLGKLLAPAAPRATDAHLHTLFPRHGRRGVLYSAARVVMSPRREATDGRPVPPPRA